jgi:uncharacterized membrane protein
MVIIVNFLRIFKHLFSTNWQIKAAFPQESLHAIEHQIKASEARHLGEIRFVIEAGLTGSPLFHDQSARHRAIDVFSQLRIWDTDLRNGVLIYLLLADHAVEIVADRGIHGKVGEQTWAKICRCIETEFRNQHYEQGTIDGIELVNEQLIKHFPAGTINRNELPDTVLIL